MSTSAEGPESAALQVMSPSVAAGREGTPQPAEVNRGSNGSLPNGVASREFLLLTSDLRPGAGDVIPSTVDEFLVGRAAGTGHESQEVTEVDSVAVAQGSLPGQQPERQMEAMMRTQSRQMEEMREEIQYLRAERAVLVDRAARGFDGPPKGSETRGPPRGLQGLYGGNDGRWHQGDPFVGGLQERLTEGNDGHRHQGDPRSGLGGKGGNDGHRHQRDPRGELGGHEGNDGRRHQRDPRGELGGHEGDDGRRETGSAGTTTSRSRRWSGS